MPVHFLLSPRAKTISLAQVALLTKDQAETMFAGIRWLRRLAALATMKETSVDFVGYWQRHRNP